MATPRVWALGGLSAPRRLIRGPGPRPPSEMLLPGYPHRCKRMSPAAVVVANLYRNPIGAQCPYHTACWVSTQTLAQRVRQWVQWRRVPHTAIGHVHHCLQDSS